MYTEILNIGHYSYWWNPNATIHWGPVREGDPLRTGNLFQEWDLLSFAREAGDLTVQKEELEHNKKHRPAFPEALHLPDTWFRTGCAFSSFKVNILELGEECGEAGVHTLQARLFRDYVKEFSFFPGQLDTYGIDLHLGNNDKFCIKYKAKREA